METLHTQNPFVSSLNTAHLYSPSYELSIENYRFSKRNRPTTTQDRNYAKTEDIAAVNPNLAADKKVNTVQQKEDTLDRQDIQHPTENQVPIVKCPSPFASEIITSDSIFDSEDDSREREYFLRCLLIGAKGAGKHTLVKANFSEEVKDQPEKRTGIDFIKQHLVRKNTTKKYHFWLKTLQEESETKEAIWQTYYKWATTYVFVYDTTSRESFRALEGEVKKILQVVPQDKFFGILVGTKNDLQKERTVDYDEVINFKTKFNFSHLFETNSVIEKKTPQLLPRLNSRLKLVFESI